MPKRRVNTLLQRLMQPSLCSLSSRLTKKREIKAMPILFFTASFTEAALLQTQLIFSGSPFLANTFFKSRSVALPFSLPTKTSPAISSSAAVRPSSGCPGQQITTMSSSKNGRYSKESCCTVSGTIARSRLLFKIFSIKVCVLLISALI